MINRLLSAISTTRPNLKQNSKLRTEHEFLFYASRVFPTNTESEKVSELIPLVTDWKYIVLFAKEHGVASVIHKNTYTNVDIPVHIAEAFSNVYYGTLRTNTRRKLHFLKIIKALNSIGITPCLFKGGAMAFHCYNEVALRPMGDIDLVVPLDRIRDVEQLFQNMGANTHWPSKEQPIRTFSAIEILPISFDNGEFIYDIHWAFIPEYLNFGLNEAAMKTRAEIIEDKDHIYKILNPSDNLITTILHNEKNIISKGVRLSLLNDIRICLRITPMESISVESYSDSTRKSVSQHIEFYSNYFDGLLKPNLLETKLGRLIIKGRSTRVKSIGMVTYVMKQKTLKKGLVLLFNTAFPPLEFMQKNHNTRSKIVALLFYPVRLFNASIYLIRYIRTELKDKFVQ